MPLFSAIECEDILLVQFLISGGVDVNQKCGLDGIFPLYLAVKKGNANICYSLLAADADVNAITQAGKTALHQACVLGKPEILNLLLEKNINVNARTPMGITPLHILVLRPIMSNLEGVKLLLKNNADINARDDQGCTPLHLLCQLNHQNFRLISLLVRNGADINLKMNNGKSVLHLACQKAFVKTVSCLIYCGASISEIDDAGMTLIQYLNNTRTSSLQRRLIFASFIKVFAINIFNKMPVNNNDLNFIQTTLVTREIFEYCTKQLKFMNSIEFYDKHSMYSILMMSKNLKKLSTLINNKSFQRSFEICFHRRSKWFPDYCKDLSRIWTIATEMNENAKIVTYRLNNIFKEYLPHIPIKILAAYLSPDDLPL